jgi:hypothetical protein
MSLVWIGGYYRSQREAFHISTRANIARGLFQIIDIIPVDLGSFLQVDGLILSRLLTSARRCPVHIRSLIRLCRLDNPPSLDQNAISLSPKLAQPINSSKLCDPSIRNCPDMLSLSKIWVLLSRGPCVFCLSDGFD